MSMMTLAQAKSWIEAPNSPVQLNGDAALTINRVHTDSRTLRAGDLFVALKGEHFDANSFLGQAKAQGASAALAHSGLLAAGLSGLQVADTRLALGRLAAGWRAQFDLPLIAVTGSNGKTTVTQMIASILRAWKADCAFATQGNLNNDIGVPMTLLRLAANHQIGVVELGMNHPGEIAALAAIAKPTIALVNNAQREHLEFMQTVAAVAQENGAVISALPPSGVAVFPADDDYTPLWRELAGNRQISTFSLNKNIAADVSANAQWQGNSWQVAAKTPIGSLDFELFVAGRHNVKNALAAAACALAAGVPLALIAKGLQDFEPVKGRSRSIALKIGDQVLSLVDDSYNANPDSMHAAIEVLAELPGPRLLVVGDMAEVGDQGPEFHAEAGAHAHASGIEQLFCLGQQSALTSQRFGQGRHFTDMGMLISAVLAALPSVRSLLVKGSRSMKMEQVVQAVQAAHDNKLQDNALLAKETPHAA